MASNEEIGFPRGHRDERELLLGWLGYLRGAVVRKASGLDDAQARWRPDGRLVSLLGLVNHLTHVEWRWIDGAMRGEAVSRDEAEFAPGGDGPGIDAALTAYAARAAATDAFIRATSLTEPCRHADEPDLGPLDLRWVVLHLVNETARHAGHADATRELLDGTTGE